MIASMRVVRMGARLDLYMWGKELTMELLRTRRAGHWYARWNSWGRK